MQQTNPSGSSVLVESVKNIKMLQSKIINEK